MNFAIMSFTIHCLRNGLVGKMQFSWKKNGTYRKGKKFMFLGSNKDGCFEIIKLCNNLRVPCGFFYLEIKQMYNVE